MNDQPSAGMLPEDGTVCVVATKPDTFNACRAGGYPCPTGYARTDSAFDYLAFYRTAPVSAITHVAAVTGRTVERRGDDGWMTPERWATLIDPVADTDEVLVFELGGLSPLDVPVRNDANGVRGAWYCTVRDLVESDTVTALSARFDRD